MDPAATDHGTYDHGNTVLKCNCSKPFLFNGKHEKDTQNFIPVSAARCGG
jgi:hypothetical protein